ncbi:MAG: sulfatase [Bacteroidetes bacterium]|nr:sulfatase [Bacteroidota bacterium]
MALKQRALFLLLALLCLAGSGCKNGGKAPESASERPNIIFIFTDDHSARAISAYGSQINETPNIDRLAREGMLFQRCFVTNSICAPSRAVILTGKYSHLNGQLTNVETFNGQQQTFPKLLRQAGYETAIVGKWHLKSEPTGFDHWQVLIGQGPYYNPRFMVPGDTIQTTGYTTDIITDLALDWLDEGRDPSKPFLLMYQHKAPHRGWHPGPDHYTMYDDVDIPEPATLFDDYSGRASPAAEQGMTLANHLDVADLKLNPPASMNAEQTEAWRTVYDPKNDAFHAANLQGDDLTRWKYQRYIKEYLRTVAGVDDNIGRLLDYLEESGLADNTVVMYSSDQGWYLGEHGWYDKRWMYEESLMTPLLVRWPDHIAPGSLNDAMVSNLDFAATFLDLAGAAIPDDMQGRSLKPLFTGPAPGDWRKSVYYHYYEYPGWHCVERHYGVRTARYKLIYYYNRDEWELFDLDTDPNELNSVYADPNYASMVDELKTELDRLREQYAVPEDTRPPGQCIPDDRGAPTASRSD